MHRRTLDVLEKIGNDVTRISTKQDGIIEDMKNGDARMTLMSAEHQTLKSDYNNLKTRIDTTVRNAGIVGSILGIIVSAAAYFGIHITAGVPPHP